MIVVLLLSLLALSHVSNAGQRIAAYGRLICPSDSKRAGNVFIKLQDKDTFSSDDDFAKNRTLANGEFYISGEADEGIFGAFNTIDPVLKISHSCNNKYWLSSKVGVGVNKVCDRYWRLYLPDSYVDSNKPFNVGTLNLEMKLEDEGSNCV